MNMRTQTSWGFAAHQRGMALLASLLILMVVTVLGIAMFRTYGLTERIGGNTREKERALHAAMAAQNFAEYYMTTNNGANTIVPANCSGGIQAANMSTVMVCANVIQSNVAQLPWPNAFTYTPPNISSAGVYSAVPQFYISYLGPANGTTSYSGVTGENASIFQVDAAGFGGSANTVAVVESTYRVSVFQTTQKVTTGTPPMQQGQVSKNISLGGP
jgi:type IV pilus assembly protein PilX